MQPRGNNPSNMTQFLLEHPPRQLVTRALEDMYLLSLTDMKVAGTGAVTCSYAAYVTQ